MLGDHDREGHEFSCATMLGDHDREGHEFSCATMLGDHDREGHEFTRAAPTVIGRRALAPEVPSRAPHPNDALLAALGWGS